MALFKIKGAVQHYAWGGFEYIPTFLGVENQTRPFAEYWLGAHPSHPSFLEGGQNLHDYLKQNPIVSRENSQHVWNDLPYLFKILDVKKMLSIQVHPDKASAIEGFERENAAGIPIDASNRNYKDANHKPEMMVALGDFYLLHGFKNERKLNNQLECMPELSFLHKYFEGNDYKRLYEFIMRLPQIEIDALLEPLANRILPLYENGELDKTSEDFWAARAVKDFCSKGQFDRGIFSMYFFNLVHLKKGEGIFQAQGIPHAYLEGVNVEVMANSDNVLRAGLTEKHIDVEELLKYVLFEGVNPRILNASDPEHKIFKAPVKEFELHQHTATSGKITINAHAGEIWWMEYGEAQIKYHNNVMTIKNGEAVYVSEDEETQLDLMQPCSLFRVLIPGD